MGRAAQLTTMVGQMESSQLHGLAIKLQRSAQIEDWSRGQEYLWGLVIAELEHRWLSTPPGGRRCSCELCVPPFPEEALPGSSGRL